MKFKFYMIAVLVGFGLISGNANAAWLDSIDVISPVSLTNDSQSISFKFAPGTVEKLWWSSDANPDDFANQNVTTIANEINDIFGAGTINLPSDFVAQGDYNALGSGFSGSNDRNGTISLNNSFNFLAIHLGSNELFFKLLSPVDTFSIYDIESSRGNGAGLSNFRAFNTAPSAVPVPAAIWLFGSALAGLVGTSRRKQKAEI